jgi:hypothetical protein
LYTTNPKKLL